MSLVSALVSDPNTHSFNKRLTIVDSSTNRFSLNDRHWNDMHQLLRISSGSGSSIALPNIIFVRIGVIADASDNQTGETINQTGCFHLKTKHIELLTQLIAHLTVFHNLITRSNESIVNPQL
jgi:hypothetical protein